MDYIDLSYLFLYLNCINILDIANLLYKIRYIQYMYRKYIHKKRYFLCVHQIQEIGLSPPVLNNMLLKNGGGLYREALYSFNDLKNPR